MDEDQVTFSFGYSKLEVIDEPEKNTDSDNMKLIPTNYYMDLFYSQLAFSYYSSLYFQWLQYYSKILNGIKFNSRECQFDTSIFSLFRPVTDLNKYNSSISEDYGDMISSTDNISYRYYCCEPLLAQIYDYSLKPHKTKQPSEFTLLGIYDNANNQFVYHNERRFSNNPWERYHVVIFIKILLIFLFFDVSRELYVSLFTFYFLYVHGIFDDIQEILENLSSVHPIEVTLANLRRQRFMSEGDQSNLNQNFVDDNIEFTQEDFEEIQDKDIITEDSVFIKSEFEANQDSIEFSESNLNIEETENNEIQKISDESLQIKEASDELNTINIQISNWTRILYQSIFMYIMTLLPWWNPDPAYLI
ncbi:uncharacterized protein CMU_021220 [Cryptosporidium muris RN66]|uniref:Uncharacterized protein n=1 Tax=Cryptosporidium muris (strain RN66) TaxID=441375 RepID=B6AJG8_CRYMR|nr:uncharacterized protein CMU_021220 [Cryptosporidium muris RN66]EEA08359.1 hypothetical protein, conserved [Cryptosporidium muris RN66]|eukprot:XP_002142708.1 hypothetical protein [Cryptosporidium muris RN66]